MGLRDPVPGPDIMQKEVAVGVDHLAAEGGRHGGHVTATLPAEGEDLHCPIRCREIGLVAHGGPRALLFRNSFSPSITSWLATTSGSLGDGLVDRMNRVNDSTSKPNRCTVLVGSSLSTV